MYAALSEAVLADNVFDSPRYFSLELDPLEFGHDEFPALASAKANDLAIAIAAYNNGGAVPTASDYEVNPPYTPQAQQLSITYLVSEQGIGTQGFKGETQLLHIHPFGYIPEVGEGNYLLPRYENEGELFIGISEVETPVDLSFLFQMAEGSANPEIEAPAISWAFLSGNTWIDLEAEGGLLSDTTNGLLNSGIVRLRLPETADQQHQLLPTNQYWLRLSAPQNSEGLSDTIGIHPNAVLVELQAAGVAKDHFGTPLLPESIQQLLKREPAIKLITQPYSSFGRAGRRTGNLN